MNFSKVILVFLTIFSISACGGGEDPDILPSDFSEITEVARGTEVSFYMWGGSPQINSWVTNYLGGELKRQYDITLKMVPINDAAEFINKLATEKLADLKKGSADLIWINGENFKNAREAELLFGPYTDRLPNYEGAVDENAGEFDFGYPVEGYEAPYGRAQFVFEYHPGRVGTPPVSFEELKIWLKENAGRFTYPQPPDFTGSAFIRQVFYETSGGWEQFLDGYDGLSINEELFRSHEQKLWDYLNEIEPYLWQEGKSYPKTITVQESLLARGEIDFAMYYSPGHAAGKILEGAYPPAIRTFVMEGNSIANTHFTAIPYNAPNKAGALVLSNLILSPEVQLSKAMTENWGDLPVSDYSKLSDTDKEAFDKLELGEATLPVSVLGPNAVPEIPAAYVELLEKGWEENVLNK